MKSKSDKNNSLLKFAAASGLKLSSREGTSLEFKESFNWGVKDEYAKTAAAFSNAKGGFFVFGVKNSPRELKGLMSNSFEELDEAKIAEYLNSVFSPEIKFEKSVKQLRSKTVGILRIFESDRKPIVAIKNDKDIKEGEIYYRYNARTDKVKYPEMRNLLDEVQMHERNFWKQMFERIAQIGTENVAVMDIARGTIEGTGGAVLIDEKLLPKLKFIKEGSFKEGGAPALRLVGDMTPVSVVATKKGRRTHGFHITDDPTAPVVRVEEESILKEFPLDYNTLTRSLRERYADFKTDNKYHRLRKELMGRGFSMTRKLNPNNPKSTKQDFYSPRIFVEFDKVYKKR